MSQNTDILAHLESGLGARIFDLRRAGYPIIRHMAYDRNSRKHFASYSLARKRRRAA